MDTPPPEVRAAFPGEPEFRACRRPKFGAWLARLHEGLSGPGFRVPRPVRAHDGSWIVDGWAAWQPLDGVSDPLARWPEFVATSRAFHAALAGRPAWPGRSSSRWDRADRFAWGEEELEVAPELAGLVTRLRSALRPVEEPSQLVHGAFTVLFADGELPAVTGFSPSWRPAAYPVAVAAVDLLTWSGGGPELLAELPDADQLLLRAQLYRLLTESLGRPDAASREAVRRANEPVADLLLSRVRGGAGPVEFLGDAELAAKAERALGRPVTGLRPVAGGHTRAPRRIGFLGDRPVFLKAGAGVEAAVYRALRGKDFVPGVLAVADDLVVLEALPAKGWGPVWTPSLSSATERLLAQVHALPVPPEVPAVSTDNPWDALAAAPERVLRLGVCSDRWLDTHLPVLHAAAASAPIGGSSLIHRDVHSANLWTDGTRLVLADWGAAAVGSPAFDSALWQAARCAEGGPPPDDSPESAGFAAVIAGRQPLLTPSREADPVLHGERRHRFVVALEWAARLLGLPRPE